ncbi:hypothetical protein A0J61_06076 [Choanephora cucurbitarum]|uniref:Uncharacterized protein n=1 Tax=Choanephora cucurbitarum TaxID=101091 RepID=A0A1C7N9Y0_9FUNG|nr:hypothetical protein A0J61_06076 [Choanephora cucurbitarum]
MDTTSTRFASTSSTFGVIASNSMLPPNGGFKDSSISKVVLNKTTANCQNGGDYSSGYNAYGLKWRFPKIQLAPYIPVLLYTITFILNAYLICSSKKVKDIISVNLSI